MKSKPVQQKKQAECVVVATQQHKENSNSRRRKWTETVVRHILTPNPNDVGSDMSQQFNL